MHIFGTTHELAKKVNFGSMNVYMIKKCFPIQKLNWEKKIKEMKNQFTAWRKRNLTIIGKHFLIIYTFILPKFTFLASSCFIELWDIIKIYY
jgi:hypothetical protein